MTHTPESIKFELTDTTITHWGVTLYQIRATEDIAPRGIRKGNLGGYVSSTHLPCHPGTPSPLELSSRVGCSTHEPKEM